MLVALLSTLELAGEGAYCPKGFLTVVGRTVIERQASIAVAVGCERVVCLAHGLSPELVEVQHMVEREGRRFHTVRNQAGLQALIGPGDEIIAIADGILPAEDILRTIATPGGGVLAMPAATGLAAGYERLDRDRCWAGAVWCTGSEVERLSELPDDVDPLSALMRCALQAGYPVTLLPEDAQLTGQWLKIDCRSSASVAGRDVLSRSFAPSRWAAPGNALVDRLTGHYAERLLAKPGGRWPIFALAFAGFSGALIAGRLDNLAGALIALTGASVAFRALKILEEIRNGAAHAGSWVRNVHVWVVDLMLIGLFALSTYGTPARHGLFPLLVLLITLHICRNVPSEAVRQFAEERPTLLLLASFAVAADWGAAAFQTMALALMVLLFVTLRSARLTRA